MSKKEITIESVKDSIAENSTKKEAAKQLNVSIPTYNKLLEKYNLKFSTTCISDGIEVRRRFRPDIDRQ